MVNRVTADFADQINVVAVAGRSSLEASIPTANDLLDGHVQWGYDESIWELYGVFGQPTTMLINPDRSFVGEVEFGFAGEDGVHANVDNLIAG